MSKQYAIIDNEERGIIDLEELAKNHPVIDSAEPEEWINNFVMILVEDENGEQQKHYGKLTDLLEMVE